MPVRHLLSIGADEGGGHVCQGFTTGSILFGDSFSSLVELTCDMAVSVATAGTVNPAAATFAGNSFKIVLQEMFEMIGIAELLPLKVKLREICDKQVQKKRDAELKKLPKPEPLDTSDTDSLVKDLNKLAKSLEKFDKKLSDWFKNQSKLIQSAQREIEVVLNAINKATTFIDLANNLKALISKLTEAVGGKNPIKIIETVRQGKDFMEKIDNLV